MINAKKATLEDIPYLCDITLGSFTDQGVSVVGEKSKQWLEDNLSYESLKKRIINEESIFIIAKEESSNSLSGRNMAMAYCTKSGDSAIIFSLFSVGCNLEETYITIFRAIEKWCFSKHIKSLEININQEQNGLKKYIQTFGFKHYKSFQDKTVPIITYEKWTYSFLKTNTL